MSLLRAGRRALERERERATRNNSSPSAAHLAVVDARHVVCVDDELQASVAQERREAAYSGGGVGSAESSTSRLLPRLWLPTTHSGSATARRSTCIRRTRHSPELAAPCASPEMADGAIDVETRVLPSDAHEELTNSGPQSHPNF